MIVILMCMRFLIAVLICTSLMINYVEHLLMRLLAICIAPLEKCLFMSFKKSHYMFFDIV